MFDFDSAVLHKGEAPGGGGLTGVVIVALGWVVLVIIGWRLWL